MKYKPQIKNIITSFLLLIIFFSVYLFKDDIIKFILRSKEITKQEINEYQVKYDFEFVKLTNDFYVKNKQHFLDIIYTALNNGWNDFTFYCDDSYLNCINEVNEMIDEKDLILNINNFVSPFNSFNNIFISTSDFGDIYLLFTKKYSDIEIIRINNKINNIYDSIIKEDMDDSTKIKTIHDYIINNTVYFDDNELSSKASGVLFNKKAICSGYTDTMALFLNKLNIPNYKIPSEKHIWNLVYINEEWLHIDLTWNDPVLSSGKNIISHDYYLINTDELLKLDKKAEEKEAHNFDSSIYKEAYN